MTSVVSQAGVVYVVLDSPELRYSRPYLPRAQRSPATISGRPDSSGAGGGCWRVAVRLTPEDQAQLVNVLARIEDTSVCPGRGASRGRQ